MNSQRKYERIFEGSGNKSDQTDFSQKIAQHPLPPHEFCGIHVKRLCLKVFRKNGKIHSGLIQKLHAENKGTMKVNQDSLDKQRRYTITQDRSLKLIVC